MKTATILKQKLTQRQKIIGAIIIAVPILVGIIYGLFILLQQSAVSSRANEEAPSNVVIEPSAEGDKVQVKWNTAAETSAILEYGTSANTAALTKVAISETSGTDHNVDITGLEPGIYYFQIKIGDKVYDNDGLFWTFTVPGEVTETPAQEVAPSISPEVNETIVPTPTQEASESATISPTSIVGTPTPVINPVASICTSTNCSQIKSSLGTVCTTQDYLKCIFSSNGNSTTATTATRTPTPTGNTAATPTNATTTTAVSTATKNLCKPSFLQANSCTSWKWPAMADIDSKCEDTYTKYFVQCKNTSFTSTDAATWYCNKTVTSTDVTIPCDNAPTPAAGQSIFCRIRGETAEGGGATATDWVYSSSSCSSYNSGNIQECEIPYLQANTCKSWIWGSNNTTNPKCAQAFSKYFFQCTDNGNFALLTTTPTPRWWFCNTTSEDHYLGLPCFNAATPADGADITCRVRAEDSYGGDEHSTAWVYKADTCPTSTPTPSITATPTLTHTPTPTFTPTATLTPTP